MTASDFQSFSSATKNVAFLFCIYVPRGALQQWISLVPNQKVTWSTFVLLTLLFTHGASKEQHKSNSSPYSIVRIKWDIWRCFEKYKALWKYKALFLALGEGHFFGLYYFFLHLWKVITPNLFSPPLISIYHWKCTLDWHQAPEKQTQSIGYFISSFRCSIYRSFAYCSRENGNKI